MIIRQDNVWSQLMEYTQEERRWLDMYTSVPANSYHSGAWGSMDDRYHMLSLISGKFPSGLMPLVERAARREGVPLQVDDARPPPPCVVDDFADLDWLRDYQQAAVWAAAEAERGLIKVPTAGGKTEIFVGLTRVLPCEWLFVVHRSDLVGQAARRFTLRTNETAGTFEGGEWTRGSSNVTVATFQGIYAAMKRKDKKVKEFMEQIQAVNVDEVHAQPADSFYKVAMSLPNVRYRIGQSGTPLDRSERDSLRTIGAIGPLVYKIKTSTLSDAGVLSKPKIYMIPLKQEGTTDATWATAYMQLITQSDARNELVTDMAERATKPCLLFVDHMNQGHELQSRLEARGLRVSFVHGMHDGTIRQRRIELLTEGKIDVLICSVIFQEGIDIPELESVVVAGGKASVVGVLQRMGRGMRVAKGKTGFEVWDVKDQGQKWITSHANARLRAYKKEGHEVTIGWPKQGE